ncbi:Cysteine synthase [Zostera marina]|uniref:cysteine synthase n=1 Tax=Zostera marina TaxID=29655 RepID=A0A0K9NGM1_ZOSMR|nr:Cysteine synthase [Zostera marina]
MMGGIRRLLGFSDGEEEETIASNITQLVGRTPLVELKKIMEKDMLEARVIGKMEFFQPLGSIKDRGALSMIEDAEEKGLIRAGISTVVTHTSGNLGIGMAFIAIQKGYRFTAVVPGDGYSLEKQILLKYLGADVVHCDPNLGVKGIYDKLYEVCSAIPDSHLIDQFTNPANPGAHFRNTGPEIWKDTGGRIDVLVCGVGSGGTFSGTGKYLKMKNPHVKVIVVEPSESPVLSGGQAGRHLIQGIGAGVITDVMDTSIIDEIITVSSEEAIKNSRRLASEEGILAGISSGAALAASLRVAGRSENKGKMVVTIFPSGGERYMRTQLFAEAREYCEKMNA